MSPKLPTGSLPPDTLFWTVPEYAKRNHIEGRIGNAKQALSLNQIKAKLQDTSETWIAAILFVLNLSAFAAKAGVTF
jgi:hypothetical protein